MSIIFRIAGLILGVLMIVYGIDMGNQSAKIYDDISLILILTGIFQCSFSLIVASIYDEVKKVKTDSLNSLSYIE